MRRIEARPYIHHALTWWIVGVMTAMAYKYLSDADWLRAGPILLLIAVVASVQIITYKRGGLKDK